MSHYKLYESVIIYAGLCIKEVKKNQVYYQAELEKDVFIILTSYKCKGFHAGQCRDVQGHSIQRRAEVSDGINPISKDFFTLFSMKNCAIFKDDIVSISLHPANNTC